MKSIIIIVILTPFFLFAQKIETTKVLEHTQTYRYSFSGAMDSIFINEISAQVGKLDGVIQAKGRYKIEKSMGEIFIIISDLPQEENSEQKPFSPIDVKAILLKNKLTPLDFNRLK